MSRKTRYPQTRPATLVVVAFVAALIGVGIPASVSGLFHGYAPHVDAPSATAKAVERDVKAG